MGYLEYGDKTDVCCLEYGDGLLRLTAISADRFLEKFKRNVSVGYVCCSGNYETAGNVVYLPAYMASSI